MFALIAPTARRIRRKRDALRLFAPATPPPAPPKRPLLDRLSPRDREEIVTGYTEGRAGLLNNFPTPGEFWFYMESGESVLVVNYHRNVTLDQLIADPTIVVEHEVEPWEDELDRGAT